MTSIRLAEFGKHFERWGHHLGGYYGRKVVACPFICICIGLVVLLGASVPVFLNLSIRSVKNKGEGLVVLTDLEIFQSEGDMDSIKTQDRIDNLEARRKLYEQEYAVETYQGQLNVAKDLGCGFEERSLFNPVGARSQQHAAQSSKAKLAHRTKKSDLDCDLKHRKKEKHIMFMYYAANNSTDLCSKDSMRSMWTFDQYMKNRKSSIGHRWSPDFCPLEQIKMACPSDHKWHRHICGTHVKPDGTKVIHPPCKAVSIQRKCVCDDTVNAGACTAATPAGVDASTSSASSSSGSQSEFANAFGSHKYCAIDVSRNDPIQSYEECRDRVKIGDMWYSALPCLGDAAELYYSYDRAKKTEVVVKEVNFNASVTVAGATTPFVGCPAPMMSMVNAMQSAEISLGQGTQLWGEPWDQIGPSWWCRDSGFKTPVFMGEKVVRFFASSQDYENEFESFLDVPNKGVHLRNPIRSKKAMSLFMESSLMFAYNVPSSVVKANRIDNRPAVWKNDQCLKLESEQKCKAHSSSCEGSPALPTSRAILDRWYSGKYDATKYARIKETDDMRKRELLKKLLGVPPTVQKLTKEAATKSGVERKLSSGKEERKLSSGEEERQPAPTCINDEGLFQKIQKPPTLNSCAEVTLDLCLQGSGTTCDLIAYACKETCDSLITNADLSECQRTKKLGGLVVDRFCDLFSGEAPPGNQNTAACEAITSETGCVKSGCQWISTEMLIQIGGKRTVSNGNEVQTPHCGPCGNYLTEISTFFTIAGAPLSMFASSPDPCTAAKENAPPSMDACNMPYAAVDFCPLTCPNRAKSCANVKQSGFVEELVERQPGNQNAKQCSAYVVEQDCRDAGCSWEGLWDVANLVTYGTYIYDADSGKKNYGLPSCHACKRQPKEVAEQFYALSQTPCGKALDPCACLAQNADIFCVNPAIASWWLCPDVCPKHATSCANVQATHYEELPLEEITNGSQSVFHCREYTDADSCLTQGCSWILKGEMGTISNYEGPVESDSDICLPCIDRNREIAGMTQYQSDCTTAPEKCCSTLRIAGKCSDSSVQRMCPQTCIAGDESCANVAKTGFTEKIATVSRAQRMALDDLDDLDEEVSPFTSSSKKSRKTSESTEVISAPAGASATTEVDPETLQCQECSLSLDNPDNTVDPLTRRADMMTAKHSYKLTDCKAFLGYMSFRAPCELNHPDYTQRIANGTMGATPLSTGDVDTWIDDFLDEYEQDRKGRVSANITAVAGKSAAKALSSDGIQPDKSHPSMRQRNGLFPWEKLRSAGIEVVVLSENLVSREMMAALGDEVPLLVTAFVLVPVLFMLFDAIVRVVQCKPSFKKRRWIFVPVTILQSVLVWSATVGIGHITMWSFDIDDMGILDADGDGETENVLPITFLSILSIHMLIAVLVDLDGLFMHIFDGSESSNANGMPSLSDDSDAPFKRRVEYAVAATHHHVMLPIVILIVVFSFAASTSVTGLHFFCLHCILAFLLTYFSFCTVFLGSFVLIEKITTRFCKNREKVVSLTSSNGVLPGVADDEEGGLNVTASNTSRNGVSPINSAAEHLKTAINFVKKGVMTPENPVLLLTEDRAPTPVKKNNLMVVTESADATSCGTSPAAAGANSTSSNCSTAIGVAFGFLVIVTEIVLFSLSLSGLNSMDSDIKGELMPLSMTNGFLSKDFLDLVERNWGGFPSTLKLYLPPSSIGKYHVKGNRDYYMNFIEKKLMKDETISPASAGGWLVNFEVTHRGREDIIHVSASDRTIPFEQRVQRHPTFEPNDWSVTKVAYPVAACPSNVLPNYAGMQELRFDTIDAFKSFFMGKNPAVTVGINQQESDKPVVTLARKAWDTFQIHHVDPVDSQNRDDKLKTAIFGPGKYGNKTMQPLECGRLSEFIRAANNVGLDLYDAVLRPVQKDPQGKVTFDYTLPTITVISQSPASKTEKMGAHENSTALLNFIMKQWSDVKPSSSLPSSSVERTDYVLLLNVYKHNSPRFTTDLMSEYHSQRSKCAAQPHFYEQRMSFWDTDEDSFYSYVHAWHEGWDEEICISSNVFPHSFMQFRDLEAPASLRDSSDSRNEIFYEYGNVQVGGNTSEERANFQSNTFKKIRGVAQVPVHLYMTVSTDPEKRLRDMKRLQGILEAERGLYPGKWGTQNDSWLHASFFQATERDASFVNVVFSEFFPIIRIAYVVLAALLIHPIYGTVAALVVSVINLEVLHCFLNWRDRKFDVFSLSGLCIGIAIEIICGISATYDFVRKLRTKNFVRDGGITTAEDDGLVDDPIIGGTGNDDLSNHNRYDIDSGASLEMKNPQLFIVLLIQFAILAMFSASLMVQTYVEIVLAVLMKTAFTCLLVVPNVLHALKWMGDGAHDVLKRATQES